MGVDSVKVILVTLKIPPCYFGLRAFKRCVLSCPTETLPRKLIKQSRMRCNEWFASKDICLRMNEREFTIMSSTDIGPSQFWEGTIPEGRVSSLNGARIHSGQ